MGSPSYVSNLLASVDSKLWPLPLFRSAICRNFR